MYTYPPDTLSYFLIPVFPLTGFSDTPRIHVSLVSFSSRYLFKYSGLFELGYQGGSRLKRNIEFLCHIIHGDIFRLSTTPSTMTVS